MSFGDCDTNSFFGTSILRDCFLVPVNAAIATFVVNSLASSSPAFSENFFLIHCPAFCLDLICSFQGKLFSIFQLLCHAALLSEINSTFQEKLMRCLVSSFLFHSGVAGISRRFRSCFVQLQANIS